VLIAPTFVWPSRAADRALIAEPKLAPLYRNVALGLPPEELSLTRLAGERPVIAAFVPTWDKALARHFVPLGLWTRFEVEPRGAKDRQVALESFSSGLERLRQVTSRDPDLTVATSTLLRTRTLAMAATGDREALTRALEDWRPFAPEDPTAALIVRRMVTSKGPIEIRDIAIP
jgi:hypothetical protein